MCVRRMKYGLERRQSEDRWKNHHDATTFNWTMFKCWFEASTTDKLQNISRSVL